jgi:hypothetical protein
MFFPAPRVSSQPAVRRVSDEIVAKAFRSRLQNALDTMASEHTGKVRGRTIAARIQADPLLVEQAAAAEMTSPARPGVVSGREDLILRLRSAALVVWAEKEPRTNPYESEP